ncbi:F-box protein CPR1-like [Rutidosis leptorrhynchoides]|uniref:F-box protein CPR1-like n=1 Tax=Rutidosis leptorrhynchoides TaxID=125765 RepID=UPI003A9A51F1
MSDIDFVKLQFAKSLENNTNLNLVITKEGDEDSIISIEFDDDSLENSVILNFLNPLEDNPRIVYPIGFCNGLLCLCILTRSQQLFAVLNVSTRKHWFFHDLGHERLIENKFYFQSFVYDSSDDDYKVVRITTLGENLGCEMMLYSLRENAWKQFSKDFPYSICYFTESSYFEGEGGLDARVLGNIIHYLVVPITGKRINMIVGFDFSTENYNEVPLPDSLVSSDIQLHMTVLGGYLCVVSWDKETYWVGDHVWIMKEYGVKKSWTKLFTVRQDEDHSCIFPVAYSRIREDNMLLMINDAYAPTKRLAWYDLKKKEVNVVTKLKRIMPENFFAQVMVGSLVFT